MNDSTAALAVLTGLALRLLIPILITGLIVVGLSRLDKRWQTEALPSPLQIEKPQCWKTNGCSTYKRRNCPGYKSDLPCWQVFRRSNGYLSQKCLDCRVLVAAPVPN